MGLRKKWIRVVFEWGKMDKEHNNKLTDNHDSIFMRNIQRGIDKGIIKYRQKDYRV